MENLNLMPKVTELIINGQRSSVNVEPDVPLLSVLRDYLDLTGTKYGCGEGRCGACSVMIDGKLTRSCVTPVGNAADKNITTIEGLARDGKLHPLQEAFIKADAMQCAFCTSGMIIAASALLNRNARPTREEIVSFMSRNVCRCCVYQRIVEAVEIAADTRSAEE
jgi:aerobic-type carbon monoxide dehydrogenase small subunit (CoxS/CutS family)